MTGSELAAGPVSAGQMSFDKVARHVAWKPCLKEDSIKRVLVGIAVMLIAGALSLVPAYGAYRHWLSVEVPFDFYVGDKAMSAGRYLILQSDPNIYQMVREDRTASPVFVVGLINKYPSRNEELSNLVFVKYDKEHTFLRSLWREEFVGIALPRTRMEQEHVTSRVITAAKPEVLVVIAQAR